MPGPCWDPLIDRTWVGVICCSRPLLTWTQDHWGNWPLKLYLMKQHTYIFRQLKNSWNVCNHVCLTYVSHDSYVSWLVAFWSKQLCNQSITCPSVLWAEGELSIMEDTEPAGSQGVRGGCGGMKSVPRCAVETTCLDAMTRSYFPTYCYQEPCSHTTYLPLRLSSYISTPSSSLVRSFTSFMDGWRLIGTCKCYVQAKQS